jgi:ATP-binding cassette subfamily F protein uup
VVSHDRYFLERVTDHALALVDGKLAFLPGGVDEYLERRAAGAARPGGQGGLGGPAASAGSAGTAATGGEPSSVGPAVPSVGPSAARLREAKKELARLDRQVERLTGREAELHEELTRAATDYARLIKLGEELRSVQAEKASIEDRWLELAEETSG